MSRPLVLGTRGSALALAQMELVKKALTGADATIRIEVKKITTSGDRSQEQSAWIQSGGGLKGMFTSEIETALLAGEIDLAVHSCKDLPGQLAEGCVVRAVLERAATEDILISRKPRSFAELPVRARVATSSVRRCRQLLALRPDLIVTEMRGNVPTRLHKLRDADSLDAIVLAQAGLDRLGYSIRDGLLDFESTSFGAEILPILPAIGQGAIALEARASDERVGRILDAINHGPTFLCVRAERELLRLLEGDCNLPIAARVELDGERMRMRAVVFGEDGESPRSAETEACANSPEEIARVIFTQLYPTHV
ncbi:MAG: hydroxymethylbilane synthase [Chthoniobacter sp.]|nr:hydroxymethylbilane synthase [Chthoniobacter sp.]